LKDQSGLQKLHDNLQMDYEQLAVERDQLKEAERTLKSDLRKLQSLSVNFSEDKQSLATAK